MPRRKIILKTKPAIEKAILVGVELYEVENLLTLDDSLAELALLCDTAGMQCVGELVQKLDHPHPKTYIGSGKVEELKILIEDLEADVVVFDDELSPRHQRELEEILGSKIKLLDRTAVILDIFAQHASTREGILQVELAQYEYRLPRLTRAWTHLARQAGGGGGRSGGVGGVGLRGPGETQLEVDRREIRHRIAHLRQELEKVREHRDRYRQKRRKSQIPVVALVGYTNAGKSTLLNRLSNSSVYAADQLFATLDPTTRRVDLPGGHTILFTDTVGFIQKLPTALVAAFRATLEEISEADLLLHVVDINHVNALAQAKSVQQTLTEIGAGDVPVVTVLNKIDCLKDPQTALAQMEGFPDTCAISALTGKGMRDLLTAMEKELYETYLPVKVFLPFSEGQLISLFHENGQVQQVEQARGGMVISGLLPKRLLVQFLPFDYDKYLEEKPLQSVVAVHDEDVPHDSDEEDDDD